MNTLLELLKQNARYSTKELASILNEKEATIIQQLNELEAKGILKGYKAILDQSALADSIVYALIELKVTPKKDSGFNETAQTIMSFNQVESVYLMAGNYDLAVFVSGSSMQEIASFVATQLSTLDGVLGTSTRFVLQKYKEDGFDLIDYHKQEERLGLV